MKFNLTKFANNDFIDFITNKKNKKNIGDLKTNIIEALSFIDKAPKGTNIIPLAFENRGLLTTIKEFFYYKPKEEYLINIHNKLSNLNNLQNLIKADSERNDLLFENIKSDLEKISDNYEIFKNGISKTENDKKYNTKLKSKQKTKNQKLKDLFTYLLENISNNVANAFDRYNKKEISSGLRSKKTNLINENFIQKYNLLGPERDVSYVKNQANDIANVILKRIEEKDHEYNYNLLVNSAMNFILAISDEEYENYFKNLYLSEIENSKEEIGRIEFSNQDWVHPTVLCVIIFALLIIAQKIEW